MRAAWVCCARALPEVRTSTTPSLWHCATDDNSESSKTPIRRQRATLSFIQGRPEILKTPRVEIGHRALTTPLKARVKSGEPSPTRTSSLGFTPLACNLTVAVLPCRSGRINRSVGEIHTREICCPVSSKENVPVAHL